MAPLAVGMLIVWMYSFFDTYDIIRHLAAGDPKPDGWAFGGGETLRSLLPQHNRLLGWGLIALGVWALYSKILTPLLYMLLPAAWQVIDAIPTLVIAVVLIAAGCWLLGLHPAHKSGGELPPYPQSGPDDNGGEPPEQP